MVQVRTDLNVIIENKYIKLTKKIICPKCQIKTEQIATKDIVNLRNQLKKEINQVQDTFVLKLINR